MKLIYFSRISKNTNPIGIINKINHTVEAATEFGIDAKSIFIYDNFFKGGIRMGYEILRAEADIILIRSNQYFMIFYIPIFIYLRFIGKKIIVDIPTPYFNLIEEINGLNENFVKKNLRKIFLRLIFPFSLWPVNKVLQYSKESKWFLYGLNRKTILTSNGINVNKTKYRDSKPIVRDELNLIGVANLAFWHGYDRVIRSLYEWQNSSSIKELKINFFIVGTGSETAILVKMVEDLKLSSSVYFMGDKYGKDLDDIFDKSHIGVCSLGLYRKNLYMASELKAREYCARGVPFILGCEDPDFKGELPFVYRASNNEVLLNFDEIEKWYIDLNSTSGDFSSLRSYAFKKIDFLAKVKSDIL